MSPTPLETKEKARLTVLHTLYELTDGSALEPIPAQVLGPKTGLDPEAFHAAAMYLVQEHLVRRYMSGELELTHAGVLEVEQALQNPTRATDHFAAVVINQVFHSPVGAVQTGAGSTANVVQSMGFGAGEIAKLVAALRQQIPPDRAELRETVADLEEEVRKVGPKPSKIRAYLGTARELANDLSPVLALLAEIGKLVLGQ